MSSAHGGAIAGEVELRAAIGALAGAGLDALSDEASLAGLRSLWPLVCAVDAEVVTVSPQALQRGLSTAGGVGAPTT